MNITDLTVHELQEKLKNKMKKILMFAWFLLNFCYNISYRQRNEMWRVRYPTREEAVRMVLEQVYLLFIYILFIELAMVTVVAIGLFVALVVTVRKLDNEKNTSLLDR